MRRAALVAAVVLVGCPEEAAKKPTPAELLVKKRVEQERAEQRGDAPGPSAPSPESPLPSGPSQTPAPGPTPSAPTQTPTPSRPAAVARAQPAPGDFVEYELEVSSMRSGLRVGDTRSSNASGVVRLQAIEVSPERTLVHVSSPTLEVFGRGLEFELLGGSAASSAPATDKVVIGGKSWSCRRSSKDESAGDGPKTTQCVGSPNRELLLGDGVVTYTSDAYGPGGGSSERIALVRAGHAELPEKAPRAFPPGTWWVEWGSRREVGSANGLVVQTSGKESWSKPLIHFLLDVMEMHERPKVPPQAKRSTTQVGAHRVDVLVFTVQPNVLSGGTAYEMTVVADPNSLQAPLPVRFGVLRRRARDQEEQRITDWN